MHRRRSAASFFAIVGAFVVAAALSACGRESAPRNDFSDSVAVVPSSSVAADMAAPDAITSRLAEAKVAAAPMPPRDGAQPGGGAAAQGGASGAEVATSMIIRTGYATVEVDSLERAIAAVQRLAATLGGWVGNTSLSAGEREVRSATIELKIPAARYEEAVAGLRPIGRVETVNSNAQDVGEEFVDLSARVANARRLEDRLVTLLATRTGKLEDVLNVERELARVREEIERHEGRLRYLRTRVATSTLTVTVHERAPLVGPTPGENIIGEAFKDAWRNFVRFIAAFIAALGTVVPVLILGGAAALAWRRWRRSRRRDGGTGDPAVPSRG
jgi:Domain of unknown function (DUF4349)